MQRSVTVTIKPDGTSSVEAHNFKGQGCAAATKEIELVLAGNAGVDKKPKPDFYATNPQRNANRV